MTQSRTDDQTPDDRDDQGVMTEAEQGHGTGGQTANVEGGVGRIGGLESRGDEEDVEERGPVPPA